MLKAVPNRDWQLKLYSWGLDLQPKPVPKIDAKSQKNLVDLILEVYT